MNIPSILSQSRRRGGRCGAAGHGHAQPGVEGVDHLIGAAGEVGERLPRVVLTAVAGPRRVEVTERPKYLPKPPPSPSMSAIRLWGLDYPP